MTPRVMAATIIFCILSVCMISCNKTVEGDSVTLRFSSGDAIKSASVNADFNEEDCIVLRCRSLTSNEQEIIVRTSKSKDMKATALIFVKPNQEAETVIIAAANVIGKEYEYDIAQAKLYEVTAFSAEAVVNTYGIPYSDWQYGAVNNSETFPCCE